MQSRAYHTGIAPEALMRVATGVAREKTAILNGSAAIRISQVEGCYRLLRRWIITCELAPGEHLNEKDLIERTGFGRTPVREALLRLDHDGIVLTMPRHGYLVTPLTEKTIDDLYAVWRLLGPLTTRLAYSNMTPDVRDQIAALERPQNDLAEASPLEQARQLAAMFEILAGAAKNAKLLHIYHGLAGDMERMFVLFLGTQYGHEWLPKAGELAAFSKSTDPDSAAAVVADSIAMSHRGIIAAFREQADADRAGAKADDPRAR